MYHLGFIRLVLTNTLSPKFTHSSELPFLGESVSKGWEV